MSTVGVLYCSRANSRLGHQWADQLAAMAAGAICLFSFLGVETAAVAAAKVRTRTERARATLLGTLATAAVYMLSLIAVFGILPTSRWPSRTRRSATAVNAMFGGTWAATSAVA